MSDDDVFERLRRYTPARLGLGRAGASLPTRALLEFGVAHARARDAVHTELDWDRLAEDVVQQTGLNTVRVQSAAPDRATYLRRPDLGRVLDVDGRSTLLQQVDAAASGDIVMVLADGLSAAALQNHAAPMLLALMQALPGRVRTPVVLTRNARVALGDEIAALFHAAFVVVAIGERPGLSSPDSLGLYLTLEPRPGRTDAERNCLSNIHASGMSYAIAAKKLAALIDEAKRLGATGTSLKDATDANGAPMLPGGATPASRLPEN